MSDIIETESLRKSYGRTIAVDGVSFRVPRGTIFGFLGPNGAGKTTTIKMLTALLPPSGGRMRINGYDPTRDEAAVRQHFGLVFQDPSLDDELSAQENMDFHATLYRVPRSTRQTRSDDLLRLVGLWERRHDYVKLFSGGMRRRLEIARALLTEPAILFLDEPTFGLDPQTRSHIWSYIRFLNQTRGLTVFFTTHYMEEAERVADRLAIIDQGKIVAEGSPAFLCQQTGTSTLEEAFIALTGRAIREEEGSMLDKLRLELKRSPS